MIYNMVTSSLWRISFQSNVNLITELNSWLLLAIDRKQFIQEKKLMVMYNLSSICLTMNNL